MIDVIVYFAIVGMLVVIIGCEFGRSIDVGDDYVSVTTMGRTKRIPIHDVDRALVRFDAFGSTVVVVTARSTRGSIVVPLSTRRKADEIFSRLVDLLRRASERGARVEAEVFGL